MQIRTAEYFYAHYVGAMPDNIDDFKKSESMIAHYLDSGLEKLLPNIYEYCAKDKILNTNNIPRHLWKDKNLLVQDKFYLHKEIKLMNPPPLFDPKTCTVKEYEYYCEMREFYSAENLLKYAYTNMPKKLIHDRKMDLGALQYLMKRYWKLQTEGLNPLDMILFLIDENSENNTEIINIKESENNVYVKLKAYDLKLKQMDRHKIKWRGLL